MTENKKKSKLVNISKRKWLNRKKHHSIGLVYIDGFDLKGNYPSLYLTIGDCSRTVQLDFTEGGQTKQDHIDNAYHKVEVLREALDEIERGIGIMEVALKKRQKKEAKAKKGAKKRRKSKS